MQSGAADWKAGSVLSLVEMNNKFIPIGEMSNSSQAHAPGHFKADLATRLLTYFDMN